jgi:Dolichyl-phosphate-mannose-protein mannosyltransferase
VVSFKRLIPAGIFVLLYSCSALLIRPFVNLPFHDDWTYAWSVEHLLKTGELRVLDWSAHYPFVQILWGTLFCLPYGFSFSTLRVSTVVFTWLGGLALYGTLREFGHTRSESVIATLVLLVNPVFFVLSFSFMTDVPFVSLSNISFFFITRGLRRRQSLELWAGCAFAACAFFVRQIAIAIPAAVLLYVLFERSYRSRRYILPPTVFLLLICSIPLVIAETLGLTSQYAGRTWVVDLWLHHYDQALPGLLRIFTYIGLSLVPIAIALIASVWWRPRFWISITILFLLTGCSFFSFGEIPRPLEGMWRLESLGHERHLLHGIPDPTFLPSWWNYPWFVLSLFSFAAVITKVSEVIRIESNKLVGLFAWYAFSHFVLLLALWLFGDRYSIVLFPPLIVLAASAHLRAKIVLLSLVVLYAIAMLVTWNDTHTSRAIAEALTWLRGKNIPVADIDAGYVFNGWNLYAHPENLPPGAAPERDVPFVTSKEKKPYVIAASPIAGYKVLREYSWSILLRSLNYRIYVLEQLSDRPNGQGVQNVR